MECMAQEPVLFEDILCQIIDMIGPEVQLLLLYQFCSPELGCVSKVFEEYHEKISIGIIIVESLSKILSISK